MYSFLIIQSILLLPLMPNVENAQHLGNFYLNSNFSIFSKNADIIYEFHWPFSEVLGDSTKICTIKLGILMVYECFSVYE